MWLFLKQIFNNKLNNSRTISENFLSDIKNIPPRTAFLIPPKKNKRSIAGVINEIIPLFVLPYANGGLSRGACTYIIYTCIVEPEFGFTSLELSVRNSATVTEKYTILVRSVQLCNVCPQISNLNFCS